MTGASYTSSIAPTRGCISSSWRARPKRSSNDLRATQRGAGDGAPLLSKIEPSPGSRSAHKRPRATQEGRPEGTMVLGTMVRDARGWNGVVRTDVGYLQ